MTWYCLQCGQTFIVLLNASGPGVVCPECGGTALVSRPEPLVATMPCPCCGGPQRIVYRQTATGATMDFGSCSAHGIRPAAA
jgi:DNA-directed RNA polymerase subunit RPC12/RpoP